MNTTLSQPYTAIGTNLNRDRFIRLIRPFAATLPTFYTLFVILFTMLGYMALLLFPVLTAWLYYLTVASLLAAVGPYMWQEALLPGSFMLISAAVSFTLMKVSFKNPAGIEVSHKNAPALASLIDELISNYSSRHNYRTGIIKTLLTREEYINVLRTPTSWFPVRFSNTLQIGLPVLLCSSPLEFKGILARELARHFCQQNPVTGWLLKLHGQWLGYARYLQRSHDPLLKPLALFFRYYSSCYDVIAFYAVRRAEIRTDRYLLEVMDDDEAVLSFTRTVAMQHFLNEKYWPQVNRQDRDGKQKLFLPYRKMSTTVCKNISCDDVKRWIDAEMNRNTDTCTSIPPLKTRLWMLGYAEPLYPQPVEQTAADIYLRDDIIEMLTSSFDKSWARRGGYDLSR
jgi:hypothetical protein